MEGSKCWADSSIGAAFLEQSPMKIIIENDFLSDVEAHKSPAERVAACQLISWAKSNGIAVEFFRSKRGTALSAVIEQGEPPYHLLFVQSEGAVFIHPYLLRSHPFFKDPQRLPELRRRLEFIPVMNPSEFAPAVALSSLTEPALLATYISTLDWIIHSIKET